MRGYRRLITALATILAVLTPIMADMDVDSAQVIAITAVGLITLIGYNGEDWLRAAGILKQIGQLLVDVADEMDKIEPNSESAE